MNNKNHLVADTPNNIKVDKSVFQKLIFLANALEQGWTVKKSNDCLLYTSPSPRDRQKTRMPSSA